MKQLFINLIFSIWILVCFAIYDVIIGNILGAKILCIIIGIECMIAEVLRKKMRNNKK